LAFEAGDLAVGDFALGAGDLDRARDLFAGITTFSADVSVFGFAGLAARERDLLAGGRAAAAGAGGQGKNRLTRFWYSGYAAYFREERASVTSSEAPGTVKSNVRKTAPTRLQLSHSVLAPTLKR
jgi:hypothetical protein